MNIYSSAMNEITDNKEKGAINIIKNSSWAGIVCTGVFLAFASIAFDPYFSYLATSWVALSLLALSLHIVWGRGGVLSLGQTAFYGLGGYAGSIVAINFADLTGNTLIWALPSGAIAGALASAIVGFVIFYGRLGPLQTTILTYTFTLVLWTIAISFSVDIGNAHVGDNGMSGIPEMVIGFGEGAEPLSEHGMFLTALAIALVIFYIVKKIMNSPFGLISDCIRINDFKTELLGYDIRKYQWLLFVLAGAVAGLAGALFAAWSNYLSPSVFSVSEAMLIPIFVLVGGKSKIYGAPLGVIAISGLSFWLGGVASGQTTLILGFILILLVLFFDRGLAGLIEDVYAKLFKSNVVAEDGTKESHVEIEEQLLDFLSEGKKSVSLNTHLITKSFGGVTPVNKVNQTYATGTVYSIVGPNGAGKSTFLRCCTGTHELSGGSISFDGRDISKWQPFQRVQAGLGIKMQVPQVFGERTVGENLWLASYSRTADKNIASARVKQLLALLGMTALEDKVSSELSHGQQQWLDIGMILCLTPDVILLDEPAAGMTHKETQQLSILVKLLAKYMGVVVIEHDMDFISSLNSQVTVLHQGEVFREGCIEDLRKDEGVLDIYLGRKTHV